MPTDAQWMAATARLAARARPISRPNPGVAALIVKDSVMIARGWTQAGGRPMPKRTHSPASPEGAAEGSDIYVTLEPCAHVSERGPACADLLANERPARVIMGLGDPDPRTAGAGIAKLEAAGIATTLLDDPACARTLSGYLTRAAHARPHVTLKLALSLDGCIALADGSSQWITGAPARAHCHAMRAAHDAILVGGGTWRADTPRLDARLPGLAQRSPQRVVLTSGAVPDGVSAIRTPHEISALDGVQWLYIEGGSATAAAFLAADLVDELHLYHAPILIGDGLRSLGALGLSDLAAAHGRWELTETRQLGTDRFSAYWRTRS